MDWIFEGDNAQSLIEILATDANDKALKKKSIKTFIDLVWGHYQAAIIRFILVPYVVSALSITILTSSVIGRFIDAFDLDVEHDDNRFRKEGLRVLALTL